MWIIIRQTLYDRLNTYQTKGILIIKVTCPCVCVFFTSNLTCTHMHTKGTHTRLKTGHIQNYFTDPYVREIHTLSRTHTTNTSLLPHSYTPTLGNLFIITLLYFRSFLFLTRVSFLKYSHFTSSSSGNTDI